MTTLTQMRDRCKQATDMVNSAFVTDPEWDNYIGQSYAELYGILAQVYGARYFIQTPSTGYLFTTDGLNQQFALPADFFKLLNVSVRVAQANQWVTLKSFELNEMNSLSQFNTQIPAAGQTLRLFYVPTPPVFDSGDPLLPVLVANGWDEYIVIDASIKALTKEESDVSVFMARKAAFNQRLEAEASNRDAGQPTRIQDVFGKRARSMQYAIMGTNLMLVGGATPGWYYGQGDWGPYGDADDGFY